MKNSLISLSLLACAAGLARAHDQAAQSLLKANLGSQAAAVVFDGAAAAAAAAPVPVDGAGKGAPPLQPRPKTDPKSVFAGPHKFSGGYLGLYPESSFDLTTGRCENCNAPREGRWYFLDETIAVPKTGAPALVWIGSNEMIEGATLSSDGKLLKLKDGTVLPFSLVPKLSTNRSYFNEKTLAYFQDRPLRLRGEFVEKDGVRGFVARTIWPEDNRIDFAGLQARGAKTADDVKALVLENDGGAHTSFLASLLWERGGGRDWGGRPVMGLMLNGAQGDDDDTHAGHFSMFTGRMGPQGEMSDWIFDNFYDMDLVSEKGIIAGLVPMDKYMNDLNSGQSYYRSTHILVAVLKDERLAMQVQEQFKGVYAKYYNHQLKYDRTTKPCASLVIDELRGDGWNIPTQGSSSLLTASPLSLVTAAGALSLESGRSVYNFMMQEKTRLFPRAAFESATADLLGMVGAGPKIKRTLTPFERMLKEDVEALIFVRLPQIPSSRKFGRYPIGSAEEYIRRTPLDHSKWQTFPNAPRPYPPPH